MPEGTTAKQANLASALLSQIDFFFFFFNNMLAFSFVTLCLDVLA